MLTGKAFCKMGEDYIVVNGTDGLLGYLVQRCPQPFPLIRICNEVVHKLVGQALDDMKKKAPPEEICRKTQFCTE
jgi:hypothetical protein